MAAPDRLTLSGPQRYALKTVKLLALDLDGTLLMEGAVLGERSLRALRGCVARGLRLVFCTGRSARSVERYRAPAGAEGPMVCFNGAVVAELPGGRIIDTTFLPPEMAEYCVDLAREWGVYYQLYVSGEGNAFDAGLLAEREGSEAELYRGHTGTGARFRDLRAAIRDPGNGGCIKGMFISSDAIKLARIRTRLAEQFGQNLYVTRTSPIFLETLAAGVSKGSGLAFVMKRLGLAPEEVMAFGDEENDLPMFREAGHSAAPANARPEVLAEAEFAVPSCEEEGVAALLEETFL